MRKSLFPKHWFPITRDPIIVILIGIIIGLTFFTAQVINNDIDSPYNTTKFINKILSTNPLQITNQFDVPSITDLTVLPEKSSDYTNITKIVTRWTEIPEDGYKDCTKYGSGWGGSGLNSSTWGHCYNCSCVNVQEIDLP